MSAESVQPIPPEEMLGSSDWDDEDLLTVAEASERLVDEVKASRERIRRGEEVGAPGLAAERARLDELVRAAARIKAAQANAPR